MPALLPVCANLYKVGAYTKDSDNINKLLVDSPDGLIKIDHNFRNADNCCEREIYGFNNDNMQGYMRKRIQPYISKARIQ